MKSFFKFGEKNSEKPGKLAIVFLLVLMIFSFLFIQPKQTNAQLVVTDPTVASASWLKIATDKVANAFSYLWKKGGSMAFQQTLRTVLNKVAVDTAKYVGSGGEGQKPLFISDPWAYVGTVGDEAAGAYLENFANNLSSASGCEKKKESCVANCGDDASCSSACANVCDSGSCKKNCDTQYENAKNVVVNSTDYVLVDGMMQKNPDLSALSAASTQKAACYATCNTNSSSVTGSSLATPAFNVCQPSSIDAKLKITLGLAEQNRPQGPDCKATDIVKNWGDLDNYGNSVKALKDLYNSTQGGYDDQLFLNDIKGIFDPSGNDMGIYLTAKTDSAANVKVNESAATNILVGKGGWLDAQLISGKTKSLPNQAQISSEQSYKQYSDSFGKYTGDAFVDALNTFLSQTAFTAFNTLMQNLGKTSTQGTLTNSQNFNDPNSNPNTGEGAVKDASNKLSQPDFSSPANYDILSQLSICQKADNPGPTDCVIDNKFMQAIAEHKTVIEAVKEGSLNGTWRLTADNVTDAYSLRNISILRKYRILPVGWEVAISKAGSLNKGIITLNDLISCFDANGTYKKFSSNFDQANQEWCRGLIDPNWVLKAPLNSCRKEGIGGQVLNFTVNAGFKGLNGEPDTLSTYNVTRAEDYCADSQTCIKEKSNGSCEAYGYCSEEKRTWDFSSDSCQPVNNTCRNFSGGATSKSVSYLENTLDYSNCNAATAGCREYSLMGDYVNGAVRWGAGKSLYFNGSTAFSACSQTQEGCTSLIRAKTLNGTNLIINSDFSADKVGDTNIKGPLNSWPIYGEGSSWKATMVDAAADSMVDAKAIKLEANGSAGPKTMVAVYSDENNLLVPSNLQIISGQAYTLSADVLLVSGDMIQANIGYDDNIVYTQIGNKNSWQHISVTRSPKDSFNKPAFFVGAYGAGGQVLAYVKNIKFEANNVAGNYSAYGSSKIYEKLLPNYLEKACYVDAVSASKNYSLKSGAPSVCNNFARKCNRDEVGCELYSSENSKFSVAAQVISSDLCPKECLNYDVYVSRLNSFNIAQKENLIPERAKKCNLDEVGCNEFTNLDSLNQGGESKEYYTELKQCIKPSTIECGAYYAWEGTDNGYQLKSYSLKKGANGGPAVTADDVLQCNSISYHSALSSPSYNSDCLEFYNAAGQVSYHLLAKTITCSDNCHAYRLTEKNIDQSIIQAAQCTGSDKNWDAQNLACQVCLNGGVYDLNQKACVYQAIPSEGKTCSVAAKDCREYNGSNGENIRLISASDFESTSSWASNCANGLSKSTISNTNNGHSIKYNNNAGSCQAIGESVQTGIARSPLIKQILASDGVAAQLKVGQSVRKGLAYSVSFIARANTTTNLKMYFYNKETQQKSSFNAAGTIKINGGNEWQVYKASLDNLDHVVSDNEVLVISAESDFYLDNFVLNEISEKYYLIKNSSKIPDSCYYDNFKVYQGADYNLGCRQYSDRAKVQHNLRQFSKLCSESGVGCEQMIDTKNYGPGGAGIWSDTNKNKKCDSDEPDCVSVPADSAIYAVYDFNKQCNVADTGCSLLGQGVKVGAMTNWTDVFRRNNPDNYNSTLCKQASVGCEKWADDSGAAYYFKDPANNTCVYRAPKNSAIKNWYKSPEKRCDKNKTSQIEGTEISSAVCVKDADCGSGNTCIADTNDYICNTTNLKTLGLGGNGNQVLTPSQSVGLCEPKESTCTEYIDPVSAYVSNLVYNPDYKIIGGVRDGWASGGTQQINLEVNKLYIFNVESPVQGSGDTKLSFSLDVKPLQSNNTLGVSTRELTIRDGVSQPQLFYTFGITSVTVSGANAGKTIVVKPAIIDYQLKSNIEAATNNCNGSVSLDQGCVLFNERNVRNIDGINGFSSLINDAYKTGVGSSPANCDSNSIGSCNSNKLIQVRPNRICSKWLSCVTYVKDEKGNQTCYALGECDRLSDDNKDCANYVDSDNTLAARVFDSKINKDSSGYSLMSKYYFGQMREVGVNSEFHYSFEDLVPALTCTRDNGGGSCSFANNKNLAKELLIREKVGAPTDYPADGKSYLKVISGYLISPQFAGSGVPLLPNKDYYLSFLINTHNSGVGGKIYIRSKDGTKEADNFVNITTSTPFSANNGWERKILKFRTTSNSDGIYRVELGSDMPDKVGNVYFDDLNIEPVLEVAPNEYVARECRLYPENSSLTCNDSITRDGFEGYCLEHDLKNKSVCSLWYPVDHINSAVTGKPTAGYTGLAPLSYCTQVNGNFNLVEKRSGAMLAYSGGATDNVTELIARIRDDNGYDSADVTCEKGLEVNDSCKCLDTKTSTQICGSPDYNAVYGATGKNYLHLLFYCVPKQSSIILGKQKSISFNKYETGDNCIVKFKEGWATYNGLFSKDFKYSVAHDQDIDKTVMENLDENIEDPVRVFEYDNPPSDEAGLKLVSGSDASKNFRLTCDSFSQVVNTNGDNMAWSDRVSSKSVYPITTPLYFLQKTGEWYGGNLAFVEKRVGAKIFGSDDNNGGTDENRCEKTTNRCQTGLGDGIVFNDTNYVEWISHSYDSGGFLQGAKHWTKILCVPDQSKLLPGTTKSVTVTDMDQCNGQTYNIGWGIYDGPSAFAGDCSGTGCGSIDESKNFVVGVATSSPLYNKTPLIYNYDKIPASETDLKTYENLDSYAISRYGRNRENIPFGATALPSDIDLLSSEAIKFRDQYSAKQKEDIFAGRPYGCSGAGCSNIGSCSLNPDVYCLVDPISISLNFNLNRKTCGDGGYGVCMPLWFKPLNGYKSTSPDSKQILKTLFLKEYSAYSYNGSSYVADSVTTLSSRPSNQCTASRVDSSLSSFCAIYPQVTNIILKNSSGASLGAANPYNIPQRGVYSLEFNTQIDKEQQPLKEIHIVWGDGSEQIITGQDARPSGLTPHVFYHYYKAGGAKTIQIKVTDNWGFYGTK